MLFPTAGIECNPFVPPLVALCVSFFTSMGGVSGAFLLLPYQMSFLGYTNPSVSATNQLYNVVAIPSGVLRFIKEGRMVWPLTWVVVLGTLPGVLLGGFIRIYVFSDVKLFKVFVATILIYIAVRMLKTLIGVTQIAGDKKDFAQLARSFAAQNTQDLPTVEVLEWNSHTVRYSFYGEQWSFPVRSIVALTFFVGILGGAYGIGGGAILSPIFVSVFGLPVYTVAGAALMGTFVTSVAGVVFYSCLASFYPEISIAPDWFLGLLLGIGGMVGMYLGARCQKFVPQRYIKWLLVAVMLGTAAQYIIKYFN